MKIRQMKHIIIILHVNSEVSHASQPDELLCCVIVQPNMEFEIAIIIYNIIDEVLHSITFAYFSCM